MDQSDNLKVFWANVMASYGEPKNITRLEMLVKASKNLGLSEDDLSAALEKYQLEDTTGRVPMPAKLASYVKSKEPSTEELAKKDADDIPMLVRQCGWTDGQSAKEQMSYHAWNFVMAQGGWQHICENLGTEYMPIGVFVSQAYESCKASRLREKTKLHNIEIEARKRLIQNPKADIQALIKG